MTVYDKLVKKFSADETTDTSNLVKKTDHNTKISESEKKIVARDYSLKYVTRREFNKLKICSETSTSKFSN